MSQSDSQRLGVVVLGTGRMAQVHLAALARFRDDGLQVGDTAIRVAPVLYGRDPSRVSALASQFGITRTSTDLDELIDATDIQVVDNCLVNSLHYGPLMRAIRNRKHVFTEKPLTVDLAEAEELLAAARAASVHHGVIQNMRFNPGPAKARELIDRGVVGRVFSARVLWGYMVPRTVTNRPTWFYKKELAGGGVVEDMMAHFFDLLRHLVGPIESVHCQTAIAWDERREPDGTPFKVEVEDIGAVTIRFKNGALGSCFASWVRRKHEEVPEFEIDGEDGSLFFSFNRLRMQTQEDTPLFRFDARKVQTERDEDWQLVDLDLQDPFGAQLASFLRGVVAGKPVRPDFEDAVINMKLLRAAYKSAAERREVSIGEVSDSTEAVHG